jgi:predicted acyl esterase
VSGAREDAMNQMQPGEGPTETIEGGMKILWDIPLAMADGVVLRADVYMPIEDGQYPVLASLGAYGKNHLFQDPPYNGFWETMVEKYPEVLLGTTAKYTSFEVADPEHWVPHGYAVMRIDSRGAGRSEGYMHTHSNQDSVDYKEWIEWAAEQPWSNGRVGLTGISYFAVNQWLVATMEPKGLAALCIWEGCSDWYREASHHGGIPCTFLGNWFDVQVKTVQHGLGSRGQVNPHSGVRISGDLDLTDEQLKARRFDCGEELRNRPFDEDWYRLMSADHSKIKTPLLSAGNWGGQGLHGRSNVKGFLDASSTAKYLEMHGGEHWTLYYRKYGLDLQKRFFDYFLLDKGDWEQVQPSISLQVRHPGEVFVQRSEEEWPLARTQWTSLYFRPGDGGLEWAAADTVQEATYEALGDGLTMLSEPLSKETEITGPVTIKIFISSDTADADIFAVLRVFDPEGNEVLFAGANDPRAPIGQGWLRASHRKLDHNLSKPWLPYHPHLEAEPLNPGEVYELDVEVWPTCLVIPRGYKIGVSILGRDFDHGLAGAESHLGAEQRGSAFFLHDGRDERLYGNNVTVYGGERYPSAIVLPVIPDKE